MRSLARLLRPLRHIVPMPWRIEMKTKLRDRSHSRPFMNKMLGWFTSPVPVPVYRTEDELERVEQTANSAHEGPLLSVVVPFYNQPQYLMPALESIWNQTFRDFELIVVNDGSTDPACLELLEALDEPRTRVIHRENGGLPAARNTGLREARGKYFVCLDSDDAMRVTHFEKMLLALESRGCDLVNCDLERFDDGEGLRRGEGFHVASLLGGNAIGNTACGMLTLDGWKAVGGYREDLRGYQDWQFWLDLAAKGLQGVPLPEPLFLYRRHGTSMISGSVSRHHELEAKILSRHPDLAANPAKVEAIENARIRQVGDQPFLNLGPEKFTPHTCEKRVLLVCETFGEREQSVLGTMAGWEVFALALKANDACDTLVEKFDHGTLHLYQARPMMPPEHADKLLDHMITVHEPTVIISDLEITGAISLAEATHANIEQAGDA